MRSATLELLEKKTENLCAKSMGHTSKITISHSSASSEYQHNTQATCRTLPNHIADKGLITKIHMQPMPPNGSESITILSGQVSGIGIFLKKASTGNRYIKMVNTTEPQGAQVNIDWHIKSELRLGVAFATQRQCYYQ